MKVVGNDGWGNTCLTYGAQTRQPGKLFSSSFYSTIAGGYSHSIFGFFSQNTSFHFAHSLEGIEFGNDRKIYYRPGAVEIGTWVDATRYDFIIELKSAGSRIYIKGGAWTDWTLISDKGSGTTAILYPGFTFEATGYPVLIDYFHTPTNLYVSPSDNLKNIIATIPTTRLLSVPLGLMTKLLSITPLGCCLHPAGPSYLIMVIMSYPTI
jgi:hypothetical protein